MKKQNALCLFLFLFCSIPYFLQAQISFKEPVHPSPTAAGLGKFGDFPVSHHTGVPNISIPIYSLQEGPIGLNISLSYHGSGIRVDEVASWVGLGWTLQAGGVITRTVMGTPDEGGKSGEGLSKSQGISDRRGWYQGYGLPAMLRDDSCYHNTQISANGDPNQTYGSGVNDCKSFYLDAAHGQLDSQPDLFSFNFSGMSGKFVFDYERKVRILNDQDIIIKPLNNNLDEWKITGPDGTKYFFGGVTATEYSYTSSNSIALTAAYNLSSTSYFLYKIESVNGDHCISINYDSEKYSFPNRQGHNFSVPFGGGIQGDNPSTATDLLSLTSVNGKRISSITCSSNLTEIKFITDEDAREDLQEYGSLSLDNEEAKALKEIIITKGTNTKTFELNLDYFNSGITGLPATVSGWTEYDRKRLKLLSIKEKSGIDQIPAHIFTYNETETLPRRLSLARDYWGYYNGADGNTGLLPAGIPKKFTSDPNDTWGGNSNRTPDNDKMQAWTLKKIKFPTGGTTEFEFEAHRESAGSALVGGLRIKKITSNGDNGNDPLETVYTYIDGKLYGGYPTPNSLSHLLQVFHYPYLTQAGFPPTLSTLERVSANPPSSLVSSQGNHIGYSIVEEDRGANGKTRYSYYNIIPAPNTDYPYRPIQSSLHSGTLYQVQQYNETGNVVQSTRNFYEESIYNGSVSAMVIVPQAIETTNPNGDEVVLISHYSINYGRWEIDSTVQILDGVETSQKHTDYIEQHTQSGKTLTYDSDDNTHETLTTFSLNDALAESNNPSNLSNCENSFQLEMQTVRSTYVQYVGTPPMPNISNEPGYHSAMLLAQDNYLSCIASSISTQDAANDAHLATLTAEAKALIERNIVAPLEIQNKLNNDVVAGTKVEYDLLNLDPMKPDYLLPNKYFKLEVDPTTFSSIWSEEVQVAYDDHSNVIQNKHPLSQAVAYIYARGQILPTAKILSANSDQVAYTSFELASLDDIEHGSWSINDQPTVNSSNESGTLIAGASGSQTRTLLDANQSLMTVSFTATMPGCGNPPNPDPSICLIELALVNLVTGASSNPSFGVNGENTTVQLNPGQYQFSIIGCQNANGTPCTQSDAYSVAFSYTNTWNEYPGFSQSISGKTGENAFYLNGSNSITRTGLPSGEYVVSYFKKNGSVSLTVGGGSKTIVSHNPEPDGWELEENIISINGPTSTISLSASSTAEIDELRLYPRFAQMSTYTYDDAFRVHTVTDINSRSTYYKYDGLRRLEYILDQDGNYVQSMEYNFRP